MKKFPEPYKTGRCLLGENPYIPYIITEDGRGVCFWTNKGDIATLGNTCSDFEEEEFLNEKNNGEIVASCR